MRTMLIALALLVVGCGHTQPTQWVVDATLPAHIQEAAIEAAQAWCDADETLCVPVVIGNRDPDSGWITAGESTDGEAASCVTAPSQQPVITVDLKLSWWAPKRIIMHEMGHAFSGSSEHLDDAHVMGRDTGAKVLTSQDISYALGSF